MILWLRSPSLAALLLALLSTDVVRVVAEHILMPKCEENACFKTEGNKGLDGNGRYIMGRYSGMTNFRAAEDYQMFGVYLAYNFENSLSWRLQAISTLISVPHEIKIGNHIFKTGTDCGKVINTVLLKCNKKDTFGYNFPGHTTTYTIYDYVLIPTNDKEHLNKAFGFDKGVVDTIMITVDKNPLPNHWFVYVAKEIAEPPVSRYCRKLNSKLSAPGIEFANGHLLSCMGTNMISYNYNFAINPTTTLENIVCNDEGWLVGSTYIGKHKADFQLTVHCVESCTANLIEACSTPSTFCKKPNFAANKMTCDTGFILYAQQSKVEKTEMECKKKSFENADKSIDIARVDPTTKAPVECRSKCHEQFMKNNAVGVLQTTVSTDGSNKLSLQCPDTKQFIVLKVDSKDKFSAMTIVCDPAKGWTAEDINSNAVIADFGFANKLEAKCIDVCTDRVDAASCGTALDCKQADYTNGAGEIKCGPDRVLRYQSKDRIREGLPCSRDTITADEANAGKKLNVQCISNCAVEFRTVAQSVVASGNDLKCPEAQILIANTVRIFRGLTCDATVGWKTAEGNTIVDFAKEVKLDATCHDVCVDTMIGDQCSDPTPSCECNSGLTSDCATPRYKTSAGGVYNANTVYCGNHHRAFIDGKQCFDGAKKECAVQSIECKSEGWFAGTDRLIDFTDTNVDITKKFQVTCKHKCQRLFIEDSCKEGTVVAGKTTCSNVQYAKTGPFWTMSCGHASEIIVLEQEDDSGVLIKKESFGNAKCDNTGWTNDKGDVLFALTKKFKVSARCEQLCHPDLLTGATVASRSYALDAPLTCTAVKEMLEFNGKNVYSDMTCTKAGWKNGANDASIKFEPNTLTNRQPLAQCVTNDCVRDLTKLCDVGSNHCAPPDFSTTKYTVTCPSPKKLFKFADQLGGKIPITYDTLVCEYDESNLSGAWYPVGSDVPFLKQSDDFDLFCAKKECTKCTADAKLEIKCDPNDTNCKPINFVAGVAQTCSRYACATRSHHYKSNEGGIIKYYVKEDNNAFECSDNGPYVTPITEGESPRYLADNSLMGCVEQIPCNEHSPLDLSCEGLEVTCSSEKLKTTLADGSRRGKDGATPKVTCDAPDTMYLMTDVNKWTVIDHLKCDDRGEWVYPNPAKPSEMTRTRKAANTPKARVVCTPSDPTVQPVTSPPDPLTQTCFYCKMPDELSCERCQIVGDHIITTASDGVCTATSNTGRFMVNDGNSESKTLTCRKDENGDYKWRDDAGREVGKMAAGALKITDRMNVWAIIGIVAASLAVLGAVAGLIVFGYVRRKREARRLEALRSKGTTMSQRIDTIIEKVSIEDPKTVRL